MPASGDCSTQELTALKQVLEVLHSLSVNVRADLLQLTQTTTTSTAANTTTLATIAHILKESQQTASESYEELLGVSNDSRTSLEVLAKELKDFIQDSADNSSALLSLIRSFQQEFITTSLADAGTEKEIVEVLNLMASQGMAQAEALEAGNSLLNVVAAQIAALSTAAHATLDAQSELITAVRDSREGAEDALEAITDQIILANSGSKMSSTAILQKLGELTTLLQDDRDSDRELKELLTSLAIAMGRKPICVDPIDSMEILKVVGIQDTFVVPLCTRELTMTNHTPTLAVVELETGKIAIAPGQSYTVTNAIPLKSFAQHVAKVVFHGCIPNPECALFVINFRVY